MSKLLARLRVLLTAAPTWIIAAVAVVQVVAVEAAKVLPEEADTIGAWAARAVAFLLGVVAVVRRVTPVLPQDRGLLPPDSGLVDRDGNPVPRDPGQVSVGLVLIVVVCVLAAVFVLQKLGWL